MTGIRIEIKVSPKTADALRMVMHREEVDMAEAVRRLVGYGSLVYCTTIIDGAEVLLRYGDLQERIVLLDREGSPLVCDSIAWLRPGAIGEAHAFDQLDLRRRRGGKVHARGHRGGFRRRHLRRVDESVARCRACEDAVAREQMPV